MQARALIDPYMWTARAGEDAKSTRNNCSCEHQKNPPHPRCDNSLQTSNHRHGVCHHHLCHLVQHGGFVDHPIQPPCLTNSICRHDYSCHHRQHVQGSHHHSYPCHHHQQTIQQFLPSRLLPRPSRCIAWRRNSSPPPPPRSPPNRFPNIYNNMYPQEQARQLLRRATCAAGG